LVETVGGHRSRVGSVSKVEKEIVLMVSSNDPNSTFQKISRLNSIRGYSLRPGESLRLHDVYFETPSSSLGRKRMNLRMRKREDAWLVTMKRSPGLLQRKRNERAELELPWSRESLERILGELSANHIVPSTPLRLETGDPIETLKSAGLVILQDRETERDTKNVSSTIQESAILAEMAFDRVTYHFRGRNVRLYEMEVESKGERSDKTLSDMKTGLLSTFGSELIPWRWGKLQTGKMIESLHQVGTLNNLIENDLLSKQGIAEVAKALRGGLPERIFRR
jgi:CYTH domain